MCYERLPMRDASPAGTAGRVLVAGLAAALCLSACNPGSSGTTTTTTSTLPPLPPTVVAYVALAGSGNNFGFGHDLDVVNLTPGATGIEHRIGVGTFPDAIAVTPDGREAYVTNYSSNSVTPINLVTGRAGSPISAGIGPSAIAITPNGERAYVTDAGTSSLGHTVTPISLRTHRVLAPIKVGDGPQGIAITPDGRRAYVTDAGAILAGQTGPLGHQVTPINLTTDVAMRPITVGNAPIGIAVTPDGSTVYVANLNSESVTPISVVSDTPGAPIAVPGAPIALAATRSDVWVVDTPAGGAPGNNVVPIHLATGKAGTPIKVGKGAQAIAIAPGNATAWVACLSAETIVPVDLQSRRAAAGIRVTGGPFAVAVAYQPKSSGTSTKKSKKKQ